MANSHAVTAFDEPQVLIYGQGMLLLPSPDLLLLIKRQFEMHPTTNKGKRTAGVDKVKWTTPTTQWNAILSLKRKGYRPMLQTVDGRRHRRFTQHPLQGMFATMDMRGRHQGLFRPYHPPVAYRTCAKEGTPQGGIISPTLANSTLDGMEKVVKQKYHNKLVEKGKVYSPKVNLKSGTCQNRPYSGETTQTLGVQTSQQKVKDMAAVKILQIWKQKWIFQDTFVRRYKTNLHAQKVSGYTNLNGM